MITVEIVIALLLILALVAKTVADIKLMTALEALTKSVTDLTAAADAVVTTLGTPHPTDAQVQAAADAVNSQTARLLAANAAATGGTTPPPVTPPTT